MFRKPWVAEVSEFEHTAGETQMEWPQSHSGHGEVDEPERNETYHWEEEDFYTPCMDDAYLGNLLNRIDEEEAQRLPSTRNPTLTPPVVPPQQAVQVYEPSIEQRYHR